MNIKYTFILIVLCISLKDVAPRNIKSGGNELIVGGIEAERHEFPFIVGIKKPSTDHYCGGSIINSEWIITAAHCSQSAPSSYTIVAGDHINNVDEETEQIRQVVKIITHQNYTALTIENDIALMQVSPPFEFNEFVQPIALAHIDFIPTEKQIVAGWGKLMEGGNFPTTLMKVEVTFIPDEECRVFYEDRIKDSMTCAGLPEGGQDACTGDSGGPLMCPTENGLVLCGCVSFGTGCARPDKPGVYSEVSYFQDWIFKTLKAQKTHF